MRIKTALVGIKKW